MTMRDQPTNHPLTNLLLAIGMILFLAISFKLGGDLSSDTTTVSQTDSVISTLNQPVQATVAMPATAE